MSILTTSGRTLGGGGLPVGILRLTEWSWIGSVMISITRSTSITSIRGVVLMSIITSGSRAVMLEPDPTFIAIARSRSRSTERIPCSPLAGPKRRLGDEADLGDACALAGVDDAADALVAPASVAPDLHLRLRREHRDLLQPFDQRAGALHAQIVPVDAPGLVHRERDVLGLGFADLVAFLRQLDRNRSRDHGNRDQEDDQQHQHHIDERRGVDRRDDFVFLAV